MRKLHSATLLLALAPAALEGAAQLSNEKITVEFGVRGVNSLRDHATRATYRFLKDDFTVTLDGKKYDSALLEQPELETDETHAAFRYAAGPFRIEVRYELRAEWRFLSKRISVKPASPAKFHIGEVGVFEAALADAPRETYTISRARESLGTADYGACLRFEKSRGLLVTAQNPFLNFEGKGGRFALRYKPDMEWDASWGDFEADLGLLEPYELSGRFKPEKMPAEWELGPADRAPGMDESEIEAFTELVRAFLLYQPTNPLNIMVGWCANDYQIDIAAPEGRAEYKRLIDMASELGAEHLLFAPSNSDVSRRRMSRDDWHWENLLWLGMGQQIRRGEWDPARGPIPASIREMLDYAESKRVKLVAYVYPVLGFSQNPSWLLGAGGTRANLGVRAFQDWLIQALEGFRRHTGISGYSFDHTFLRYEGASRYAQWSGWRRVMETLRRDMPDIVIDGRQAYHQYGPWGWLAGSYPHPTANDEQPESFVSFPDLKIDRVAADRERYTAYRYRNYEFVPSEIVPGFITHQTGRNDDSGEMPMASTAVDDVPLPFRRRDWDYLGWRYSLLSSIALAGWNNVIDMIPARDLEEFRNFSSEDRVWFLRWIDWADANKEYLRHTRTMGPPAIGKVDGTSAIVGGAGYVFLFNPNGRAIQANFALDDSIGLAEKGKVVLREVYPLEGRLIGKPGAGIWSWGDDVKLELAGGSAMVLRVEPEELSRGPRIFNAPGRVTVDGRIARLTGVAGEAGTSETLLLSVPNASKVEAVRIGEKEISVRVGGGGLIEVPVTFSGARFRHYQQVDTYDPAFTGGAVTAVFRIPQRIFDQLRARRKAWPIPWTAEDLRSTWLAPDRLLLYVQFAEPDDRWPVSLRIDGEAVELRRAYASVRANRRNFVGFYADVSRLAAEREHLLELEIPRGLKPGQFQGVFFENVETEYTAPD